MDSSTIDHSDSDSGDSWTLIENNSAYADDAPDSPDQPIESSTPENHEKDEDTDGISIITDSEPDSSSPCQISYEHYLSEENSTREHHLPQFITVNSDLPDFSDHNESKEDDDFLGETGAKHKTYVHRRNKRLSTVLNIIMLGSVITAAGVAIGHMWGAKTDCSMHTSTNVNKILSNLYKLQEENAYLWSKLKELTALNNYQVNQHKTNLKQNKCKKMFEEPLINNDSKKVTKCVDDMNFDKFINSHMAEAAKKEKPDEFLNETKDLTNERKSYADSLKYFEKEKPFNIQEKQAFKPENRNPNENRKLHKKSYDSEVGSLNDINKETNENNKENFKNNQKLRGDHDVNIPPKEKNTNKNINQLRGEQSLQDDFTRQDRKKRENNNKILKEENKDSNVNDAPQGPISTEKEFSKSVKDKNRKKNKKSEGKKSFQMKYEDIDNEPKSEHDADKELFRNMEQKIFQMDSKEMEGNNTPKMDLDQKENISKRNLNKKNKKEKNKAIKTKGYNKYQTSQEEFGVKNSKDLRQVTNAENIVVKTENTDINENTNAKYDYQNDSSDEDIKKDNRYVPQKQKQERKKYDRQQLYKKNKKRNKYEQWEMKGGLFKDFDEISTISSQDKEYFFGPNLMDDKVFIRQLGDNVDTDTSSDNPNSESKNSKMNTDDEINWLDKRAKFRKEARQQLEEESFSKDSVNAGWYFRRMRKREQTRKGDNGTYRKILKQTMNFK